MSSRSLFKSAFPYQDDILALPVTDLDVASIWYCAHFGMREISRGDNPFPAVILERDGTRIGFAINGGDAAQDGAAVLVSGISALRDEFESKGVKTGNWRVEERDGQRFQVFLSLRPMDFATIFTSQLVERENCRVCNFLSALFCWQK